MSGAKGQVIKMKDMYKSRIERAKKQIAEHDLDCLLLYKPNNVAYYTGVIEDTACACVVMPAEGEPELVTLWYDVEWTRKRTDMKVVGWSMREGSIHDRIARVVGEMGIADGKFAFEADWMLHDQFQMLQTALPNAKFLEGDDILRCTWIEDVRIYKTPDEVEKLRKSAEVADLAMDAVLKVIKPGITGFDIAAEAEYVMKKHHSSTRTTAHPIMIAYGELLHRPHPFIYSDKIENNGLITIDFGAVIDGYHSDLARTIALGKITKEDEMAVQAVLNGQTAGIQAIRPGVRLKYVHKAVLEGFGDYRKYHFGGLVGHSLGLGNGLQSFDIPYIDRDSELILEKDMVWGFIEVSPFIPGVGAPRFEDAVVVTENGAEVLSRYPRELIRI